MSNLMYPGYCPSKPYINELIQADTWYRTRRTSSTIIGPVGQGVFATFVEESNSTVVHIFVYTRVYKVIWYTNSCFQISHTLKLTQLHCTSWSQLFMFWCKCCCSRWKFYWPRSQTQDLSQNKNTVYTVFILNSYLNGVTKSSYKQFSTFIYLATDIYWETEYIFSSVSVMLYYGITSI